MSYEFSGAVEVPMGDIEESIKNFSEIEQTEAVDLLDYYYRLLERQPQPVHPFFGRAKSREDILSIWVIGDKLGETNHARRFIALSSITQGREDISFKVFYLKDGWDGVEFLTHKNIPQGRVDLIYPKAKVALLNPQQARFVKEFK